MNFKIYGDCTAERLEDQLPRARPRKQSGANYVTRRTQKGLDGEVVIFLLLADTVLLSGRVLAVSPSRSPEQLLSNLKCHLTCSSVRKPIS